MDPTPPGGVRSWTRLAEGRGGGGAAQDRRLLRLLQELAPADGQAADVSVATLSLLVFPIATHLTNSPGGRVASGLRVQCWGACFGPCAFAEHVWTRQLFLESVNLFWGLAGEGRRVKSFEMGQSTIYRRALCSDTRVERARGVAWPSAHCCQVDRPARGGERRGVWGRRLKLRLVALRDAAISGL